MKRLKIYSSYKFKFICSKLTGWLSDKYSTEIFTKDVKSENIKPLVHMYIEKKVHVAILRFLKRSKHCIDRTGMACRFEAFEWCKKISKKLI